MTTENREMTNTQGSAVNKSANRLFRPLEDVERLFEGFFPRSWLRPQREEWPLMSLEMRVPRVDVVDRDDDILVRAEIPGVEKKDLEISLTEDMLTIKGGTRQESKEEKGDYYRSEISSGMFARTITLPSSVNADKAKSEFKDGVLKLSLPKVENAKRRTIKVD